jgi:Ser/Thr protein kinase RdoA (MazF antagonist)
MQHAYEALTPDLVLDALDSVGLRGDGRLLALSSYENRVYQVHLEDADLHAGVVVAKFYRPERWSRAQIEEEHSFAQELVADEIPVVAPLVLQGRMLHEHGGFMFSVSPRRGGRRPELDEPEVLEWIGRFLGRIHSVGSRKPFAHRPAISVETFGTEPRDWLLAQHQIPLDVQSAWTQACDEALAIAAKNIAECVENTPATGDFDSKIRLHGDCHPGNILWTPAGQAGEGPHFVDLDDARSGPAVQDLWMLLSGDRKQQTFQLSCLLDGYEQFREFNRRELQLIEPLRTLRLIHYSAWLARRWSDPAFPIHFSHFGTPDYWHGQVHMLHGQIEAMQSPALVVY